MHQKEPVNENRLRLPRKVDLIREENYEIRIVPQNDVMFSDKSSHGSLQAPHTHFATYFFFFKSMIMYIKLNPLLHLVDC